MRQSPFHPPGRFRFEKLEERIAPSATVLDPDIPGDSDAHVVITPSGNVNGNTELVVNSTSIESDFHLNPHKL